MTDLESHFTEVAKESVEVFEEVARKVNAKLADSSSASETSIASLNTFTDSRAVALEQRIHDKGQEALRELARTPAIARVVARGKDGKERIYYIAGRANTSLDGGRLHASYRSPIGRLAALPPGEELVVQVPGVGRTDVLEVIEVTKYRPFRDAGEWDSKPILFEGFEFDVISYPSLRSLFRDDDFVDPESELEALLGGHEFPTRLEGIRHEVRMAIALREQPILDRFQDEIFRLPLNSSLIILGPPGTGKTTTLIKRLGQKLDIDVLDSEERRIVEAVDTATQPFSRSWLMFTPTDLLKHYVREAFNREQIPATESHIRTWDSMRLELARRVLGILQSASAKGKFVLKESVDFLSGGVTRNPTKWFDDLEAFHNERILKQLTAGIQMLDRLGSDEHGELISRIRTALSKADAKKMVPLLESIDQTEGDISPVITKLKAEADAEIRKHLTYTFNSDRDFLKDLAAFLDTLQLDDDEEVDIEFDDEAEESQVEQTSVQKAAVVYGRTLRSVSRFTFQKRAIPSKSKTSAVAEWLGDRMPDARSLNRIGENIATQNALRRFTQAQRRFVLDAPISYRAFRKARGKQGDWYDQLPENSRHLSQGELDGVILLMLRCSRSLYARQWVRRQTDSPRMQYLKLITDRFKAQILVDEATDFSPIQLACMRALTNPETESFFVCGDFNQRITAWGTRDVTQLKWASPRMEMRSINLVYRQSKRLNDFANRLLNEFRGDVTSEGQLPESSTHAGVAPALGENCFNAEDMSRWLFERIEEVERMVGADKIPSIAILVNSEGDVESTAAAMNVLLEEINLQAVPCRDGQSLGEQSQIRVFDVRHIKGLEFEAVFFTGVDDLAKTLPDLFQKYLYVGATRAATYFGMTCSGALPSQLEALRPEFTDSWQTH